MQCERRTRPPVQRVLGYRNHHSVIAHWSQKKPHHGVDLRAGVCAWLPCVIECVCVCVCLVGVWVCVCACACVRLFASVCLQTP